MSIYIYPVFLIRIFFFQKWSSFSTLPSSLLRATGAVAEAVENERAREIRQTNLAKTEVIPLRQGSGEGRTKARGLASGCVA
jgi:hypothetical protein